MKCHKCKYATSCLRTIISHTADCAGPLAEIGVAHTALDREMHCICGFSTSEGNALARHLATCGRRSAYPSVEAAQENTVKRNMLDMLGLVRRDDDDIDDADEPMGGDDDGDDALLMPDVSKSHTGETVTSSDAAPQADHGAVDQSTASADQPMEVDNAGAEAVPAEVQPVFNIVLSLDDLVGPASVAPATGDADQAPAQLRDEYRSLATPKVAMPIEGDVDQFEKAQIEQFIESL